MTDLRERVARTLAPLLEGGREFDNMLVDGGALRVWSRNGMAEINDVTKDDALEAADAVIAALLAELAEPTQEMLIAGDQAWSEGTLTLAIWQAMLAAHLEKK